MAWLCAVCVCVCVRVWVFDAARWSDAVCGSVSRSCPVMSVCRALPCVVVRFVRFVGTEGCEKSVRAARCSWLLGSWGAGCSLFPPAPLAKKPQAARVGGMGLRSSVEPLTQPTHAVPAGPLRR